MQKLAIAVAILLLAVSLNAQWLDWRSPDIPRTADGKPNLTAPTPRTSTGKPDFSGIWQPELSPYRFSVILDLKDEVIFRPAAEAIFQGRVKDYRREDPVTNCLPAGPSEPINVMYRIIQTPALIAMLFESGTGRYRQIHMDGRQLPEDPSPSWLGYSIGRWDGDTLVVESTGFNDRTWLDRAGHPHSKKLRVTEKLRRVDFGHMQYQITYDDPEMLTKPLTLSIGVNYRADTDMLENVCNENNNPDRVHLVGTEPKALELSPAVLTKYVGTYVYREGSQNVLSFMGRTQKISLVNGQLYLNALPLIAQSETTFESSGADAEFLLDAKGTVTRLVLTQTEGTATYDLKR